MFATTAQIPSEVLPLIDQLSSKNDRWLMIAWMVVCIIAFYFFSRWVMNLLKERDATIKEMGAELGRVRDTHNQYLRDSAERFAGVVADNTKAFLSFAQALGIKPKSPEPQIGPLDLRP